MWFTRVSIQNPVMAVMVMLAFVVLGLFSYQRLSVDQFPNIDFPTVVVQMDYPGASPEIVESEVTKKVEEAVNTVAGISALTSRSYEGTSVVIIEFNLDIDGRKAAEDVREKVALVRPLLRDEVKEPRISRFDPQSTPIFNVAVLSSDDCPTPGRPKSDAPPSGAGSAGDAVGASCKSTQELTTWATQVLQKRLENVRGVGSVSVVGGLQRQIQLRLRPQAMEALGITVDQVLAAVKSENQQLPMGNIRSLEQERVVQINARLKSPEDFRDIVVARKALSSGTTTTGTSAAAGTTATATTASSTASSGSTSVKLWQVADVVDGPQEVREEACTALLGMQNPTFRPCFGSAP